MLNNYDEERFIPGIYNYCDRWCERCSMTQRCLLYYQDSRREAEHLAKGEDPHAWNIVLQDLHESFQETLEMLRKHAEEEGIDLDAIDIESEFTSLQGKPVSKSPDPSDHPLHIKAHKYAMDTHKFLGKLHNVINEEIDNINAGNVLAENIEEIKECFEVIAWYHIQIAVKIQRALCGKMEAELEEEYEGSADFSLHDANGSAKVAYHGLIRTMDALTKVYEWKKSLHDDIMPLLTDVYGLINGVDREFPGHKDFKRPGFDE
ncbi:hypothetical protein FJZ31_32140 [Candidatus Poribacteria bacterium]|nr:hypothetical protein [Candidatus Poribacteria bacterium]